MLLPLLGIFALVALAGCSRREDESGVKKSLPCPKGWEGEAIVVERNEVRVCHQEGAFALEVGDRFVRADEKDFKTYQEKFRLPNFEGLNVKIWAGTHRQVFPQGASREEAERFQSLQNYFQEKNLVLENVLTTAQKIPWLREHRYVTTWKTRDPQEKMDALALAGVLMGIQNGKSRFYEFEENRKFVDAVFQKIGKLSMAKQKLFKDEGFHNLSQIEGWEKSAAYSWNNDTLLLGDHIDPSSLANISNDIHELFHFHQDILKLNSNFLQADFAAYAKQGEFVVLSLQDPVFLKKYQGVEDYLQKEYLQKGRAADDPILCGIRYAQALLENSDLVEKKREELLESIHRYHYSEPYLVKNFREIGNKAVNIAKTFLALSQGNQGEALKLMETEIQNAQEVKTKAFKELENYLSGLNADSLDDSEVQEADQKFREAFGASIYLILLEECQNQIASGKLARISLEMNRNDSSFEQLFHTVAKYQPLKYQPVKMDGVD